MKSIKWKLVVIYLTLVFIVMIVSGSFIILRVENVEVKSGQSELRDASVKIINEIINKYSEAEFQGQLVEQYKGESSFSSRMQVNVLNHEGKTVATTTSKKEPYLQFKNTDIIKALAGNESFSYGKQDKDARGLDREWMNYAVPISDNNRVKYVVFVRMDISNMKESLAKTTEIIVVAVVLAMSLGSIIGYVFARTLTGPITELTSGARQLAQGNLSKKLKVGSNDEIGQLTESFNDMANELSKTMSAISSEKNKLETVLNNMTDGVLAYDHQGYLIHANPAAADMLELSEIPVNVEVLLERFNLEATGEEFLNIEPDLTFEHIIDIGKKYIQTNAVPYFSKGIKAEGVIVVLQDITKQKKLDDMRKEFVANVSHELRTPLTTVKSYAETLLDGALEQPEVAHEFLQIIDSEADRMALLVSDLLQLSRFDNNQFELKRSVVGLDGVLQSCFNQHKILAEKKNQNYSYTPMQQDIDVNIDADRICQVLSNVIGNAIKYSPDGATIAMFTAVTEGYVKVYIKDNGIGIPKADLPRIFERFYRVDKARSRAMGGTGLGLAISKEIMELHGGSISAESEYGKGTTMTIWIPKSL